MIKNPKTAFDRITNAIHQLYKQGVYPSTAKISELIGRRPNSLSGPETKLRTELFKKMGIKKRANASPNSDFEKSMTRIRGACD